MHDLPPAGGGAGRELINAGGHYRYMGDLRELDLCVPLEPKALPHALSVVVTPLRREAWSSELQAHPDAEFVRFILQGLENGFRIGFEYVRHTCTSAKRNMLSAVQHPQPIASYIEKEHLAGRIVGPLPPGTEGVQVSRFGVIPKPHQPGKWRLITDLSSPKGGSVNDGISSRLSVICVRRRRSQHGPAVRLRLRAGQVRHRGGVSDRPRASARPPTVGYGLAGGAVRGRSAVIRIAVRPQVI